MGGAGGQQVPGGEASAEWVYRFLVPSLEQARTHTRTREMTVAQNNTYPLNTLWYFPLCPNSGLKTPGAHWWLCLLSFSPLDKRCSRRDLVALSLGG